MNPLRALIFASFIALAFASCKDDKEEETPAVKAAPKAKVVITPVYGDQPFSIGTVYTTSQGYRFRVETLKSYLSSLQLKTFSGDSSMIKDLLVHDFSTPLEIEADIKEDSYDKIKLGIGVPAVLNKDQDPSQYPSTHPLSVAGSNGMFWTWNTGYIFTKFEGRADLTGTDGAALLNPFAFHSGDDRLYRSVELPINIVAEKDGQYTIHIKLDIQNFLDNEIDPIDLSIDYITHTSGNLPLASRFVENLATSFEIE